MPSTQLKRHFESPRAFYQRELRHVYGDQMRSLSRHLRTDAEANHRPLLHGGARKLKVALLAALVMMLGPVAQSSHASNIADVGSCDKYGNCSASLYFTAGPMERNDVTAVQQMLTRSTGQITVTDTGAPLRAGTDCMQIDEHTAVCGAGKGVGFFDDFVVLLGSGNDHLARIVREMVAAPVVGVA